MSIKAFKGFMPDMTCRGFQYEEGNEYETDRAKLCEAGFHACEHPLDCFGYYEPGVGSVYHEVELDGEVDREGANDSKVAATKIKVGARLDIAGMVKAAVDFVMSRVKPEVKADEDWGASSATGYRGASSAMNPTAVAVAWGPESKARGVKGAHIVVSEWRNDECKWTLLGAKMVRIDGKKYKAETWYTLKDGKVVEVQP